jgi:hypothetical protein
MGGIGDVAHRSAMHIKLRLILMALSAGSSIASATPALAQARGETPLAIAQRLEAATGGGLYDPTGASADFAVPRDTRPR